MGPFVCCQIRNIFVAVDLTIIFFKMKKLSVLSFIVSHFIIIQFAKTRYLLVKVDKDENHGHQSDLKSVIQYLASNQSQSRDCPGCGFPPPCFHGSNQIRLENGNQKLISEVKIGDSVLAVDENGKLKYSPVILHLDGSSTKAVAFVTIRTKTGRYLTLTPQHLMYKSEKDNTKIDLNELRTVFAEDIRKGDIVLVLDDNKKMKKDCAQSHENILTGTQLHWYANALFKFAINL